MARTDRTVDPDAALLGLLKHEEHMARWESVLGWFRTHWHVRPVFQRFKSLPQLGHQRRRDDESVRA